MAAADRPVFTRPIEITSSNDSLTIGYDPGGGVQTTSISLTNGVYGCVNSAIYHLNEEIKATAYTGGGGDTFDDLTFDISIGTDAKVNITCGSSIAITWTDTDLAAWLGFEANLSSGASFTADWTPSHLWLPAYQPSGQIYWTIEQGSRFFGAIANNGRMAGSFSGDRRYKRTLDFTAEYNWNCMRSFEDSEYTLSSTTYYPKADRCFEHFIEQSRIATSSSTNQTSRGVYFWHSITDFQTLTGEMGDGGVMTELGSGADAYVFCTLPVRGAEVGTAFFPVGMDRYRIAGVELMSATAPEWDVNSE